MNAPPSADKFRAYRARKRAAGFRQFSLWILDVSTAEFRNVLTAQIDRINASEEERDALLFTEAATADLWAGLD